MTEPAPPLTLADLDELLGRLDGRDEPDMIVRTYADEWKADAITREKTGEGTVLISKRLLRRLIVLAVKGMDED